MDSDAATQLVARKGRLGMPVGENGGWFAVGANASTWQHVIGWANLMARFPSPNSKIFLQFSMVFSRSGDNIGSTFCRLQSRLHLVGNPAYHNCRPIALELWTGSVSHSARSH